MKNPKRVGATIERKALKLFIARLRNRFKRRDFDALTVDAICNEIEDFAYGRTDRIKKKGGL